jgi:hypothetical protein
MKSKTIIDFSLRDTEVRAIIKVTGMINKLYNSGYIPAQDTVTFNNGGSLKALRNLSVVLHDKVKG